MNKTPSVFLRNFENMHEMTREVNPLCQWVLDGEGVPTRKYDGSCVMRGDMQWWARREVKKDKTPPIDWVPVEVDDITGKRMGWEPIANSGYYRYWQEAYMEPDKSPWADGTYELCGPAINRNPEKFETHRLIKHSEAEVLKINFEHGIDYNSIQHIILYMNERWGWEGLVWHHPDGRMAKMKARDYDKEAA